MDSRQREVEQGLREPSGCLTFVLVAEDYSQGFADFESRAPWPESATASYELGRARAGERAGDAADLIAKIDRDQEETRQRVRALLADRPEILADYDARMAELKRPAPS